MEELNWNRLVVVSKNYF